MAPGGNPASIRLPDFDGLQACKLESVKRTMVFQAELRHPLGEFLPQRSLRNAHQRQRKAIFVGAQEAIQPGEFGSGKVAHA